MNENLQNINNKMFEYLLETNRDINKLKKHLSKHSIINENFPIFIKIFKSKIKTLNDLTTIQKNRINEINRYFNTKIISNRTGSKRKSIKHIKNEIKTSIWI